MSDSHPSAQRPIHLGILGGAIVATGIGLAIARPATADSDTLPLSEVKPGMKGYGLTVMSGTKPEKFDVEIISTLTNFRPNQNLILIKTPNPRLDVAHTVAGMSGSPIYLNGKMIGAYAYGWTFGAEPIAGVTPISNMIDELKKPIPPLFLPRSGIGGGSSSAPKKVSDAGEGRPSSPRSFATADAFQYDLDAHAKQLAQRFASERGSSSTLAPAETPILFGGMTPSAMHMAESALGGMGLEALAAGGSNGKDDPDAPKAFEDGGAIGVQLLRGDVSAMGLGTVTRVSGDKLVAFGHPMMGGGASDLPTAIAKVHWILASTNRSFKIGEAVRTMGTLVNDRQAAIVVDSKREASTFPIHIDIQGVDGAVKPKWDCVASHDPFMAPMFVAMAIGSALETTTAERGDMTWRATTKLKVAGYGSIELIDFGSGSGDPIGADSFGRSRMVRALGSLLNNPWENVRIESVDTTVKVSFKREVAMIRGTTPLEQELDPGEPLHVKVDLVPYLGKVESKVIEVPIPKDYAGQDVDIELSPGYDVERPRAAAESVGDLVAQLTNPTYPEESLVATLRIQDESGAAFKGRVATRLPPGALDTFKTSASSVTPETFGAYQQTAFPMQRFIVGRDRVHVKVRANVK